MHVRSLLVGVGVVVLCCGTAFANIEIAQEHSFDASPGKTVVIDASFHEVEVTARPGNSIQVSVWIDIAGDGSRAKETANRLQPVFKDDGRTITVRSVAKSGWSWRSPRAKGKISIAMPPDHDLIIDLSSGSAAITGDLGDAMVRFDGSSGSLTVDGAMRELRTDTSSGSIRAKFTRPVEQFSADASSGSVKMTGGARHAAVDTSSGSITLTKLSGDADLAASSGSIKAQWIAIPNGAKVRAGASSGSVTLEFPAGTELSGEVEVGSGGIHTDFPGSRSKHNLRLSGGADAVDVRVDTSSGSVTLLAN